MDLFGIKATINRAVSLAVQGASNQAATAGLYNEKIFGWLNNNQPVFWSDNPQNYVVNGYQGNGDVFTCINKQLKKLSFCPLLVYTVKNEQDFKRYKALRQHDIAKAELFRIQSKSIVETEIKGISDLINKPNPMQTTSEWLQQLAGFYLLNGNSYNYYNGLKGSRKWSEMYVLPAPMINIISGGDLQPIKGYQVFNSRNWKTDIPDFPAENVSHFKTFNPNFTTYGSQLYGQSPLLAYILTLVRNKDSRIEQNKQVKNGGAMGILSPKIGGPSIADPKVKADLKQQIAEAKDSNDLVKRIFVSGAPAEWIQFGLSSVELELLKSIGLDRVDIANAYDMPITLLNNMEASTDNNVESHMKQFIYNCIMTLGNTLTDKLTRDICPPYEKTGERIFIMFDYSVLPELADDMSKIATALGNMWWITPNEKREFQGWGKAADDNADKILVPKTYGLLEDIQLTGDVFTQANAV